MLAKSGKDVIFNEVVKEGLRGTCVRGMERLVEDRLRLTEFRLVEQLVTRFVGDVGEVGEAKGGGVGLQSAGMARVGAEEDESKSGVDGTDCKSTLLGFFVVSIWIL